MAYPQLLVEENYGKWLERDITLQRKGKSSRKKQQRKQTNDVFLTDKQITKRIIKDIYANAFKKYTLRKRNQLNAKLEQNAAAAAYDLPAEAAYDLPAAAAAATAAYSPIMYEAFSDDYDCLVPNYDFW